MIMKQKNKENVENQIVSLLTVLSTPRGKRSFTSPAELGFSKSIVENIKHLVRLEIEDYEMTKKEQKLQKEKEKEKNSIVIYGDKEEDKDVHYGCMFLYYFSLVGFLLFILVLLSTHMEILMSL